MKKSTIAIAVGAVALVGVAAFVLTRSAKPTQANAAKPSAPGPNGVFGWNLDTLNNLTKDAASLAPTITSIFSSKSSQSSFGAGGVSLPIPNKDPNDFVYS